MAMLNFKHGLYANLFKKDGQGQLEVPISNGTIYVTTDERSMYVDLKGNRIRIQGSVLYYDSVESFTASTTPPYNTDTLYFFRKIGGEVVNAIMAYDGSNWVQINVSDADFQKVVQN